MLDSFFSTNTLHITRIMQNYDVMVLCNELLVPRHNHRYSSSLASLNRITFVYDFRSNVLPTMTVYSEILQVFLPVN